MWQYIIATFLLTIIGYILYVVRPRTQKPKQHTFIYCKCSNELISSDSFISDTGSGGDNHVLYKCTKCGKNLDFNFDIAPIPINWEQIK